ncbi:unnamed protein product [Clavelina lepadiformis]|uniref:HTH psq-type domain-containing protein n=1 Tax=Clavelina lepadiformis TaxID=159417 RepID=A0ABP0GVB8_CLALP
MARDLVTPVGEGGVKRTNGVEVWLNGRKEFYCITTPRNRQRTSTQQSWTQEAMTIAIRAVNEKRMGYHKASKEYGVPKMTLIRRVQGDNINATGSKKGLGRFHSTFSEAQEKELVAHVLELELRFFGVTRKHLQSLAFELAEKNHIKHLLS